MRESFADTRTYAMQSRFESLAVELDEVQAISAAFFLHPHPPAAHPSDPLPYPSSPSSSDVSDDDAFTPDEELLPTNLKLRGEKIVAAEPLEALETLETKVGCLKTAVHKALLHNPGAHAGQNVETGELDPISEFLEVVETLPDTDCRGLVSPRPAPASPPRAQQEQDAVPVQRVRLLETELRDKISVLEQEKREVQKLRQEILTMDAERQMFEKQLSKAEDAARAAGAAGTRFRKLEDDAVRLQKVVELLREEKEREVSDMRRSLDDLQKAIDQQECFRQPCVSSGRGSPPAEHAARQKGTSSDEVGMWSGRYMNGRSSSFLSCLATH